MTLFDCLEEAEPVIPAPTCPTKGTRLYFPGRPHLVWTVTNTDPLTVVGEAGRKKTLDERTLERMVSA